MFNIKLIYLGVVLTSVVHRKVALIVFYDKEGKILLQDRQGISKYGEKWGYFGGGIEENETPEEAVIRETKEELEFNLKKYKYIGIVKTEDKRGIIERHVFISPLPKMEELQQKEGKSMQLFTLKEAKIVKSVFGDDKVIQQLEKMKWPPHI